MLEVAQIVLAPVKHLVHDAAIALAVATEREGAFDAVSFNANLLQGMFDWCYLGSFRAVLV